MPDAIQPQQLIDALTANGWTPAINGGVIARFDWPETGLTTLGPLAIFTAPDGPDRGNFNPSAIAVLARAADTGRRASRVLASLGGQQDAHARTSHGHPCCGMAAAGVGPGPTVARCGGPTLCTKCRTEANMIHARFPMADTVKSSTDEEQNDTSSCPASDSGPTPRAQSAKPDDMYRDCYFAVQEVLSAALGPNEEDGAGEGIAADVLLLAEQRDLALPFLRDGALAEHHAKCGEASQWDIRRCEDADCLERARLLEARGLIPKEWGAYLATPPAGLDLSPAVERITAIAPGADLIGDTWLPAEVIAGWAHAGGVAEPEPPLRISAIVVPEGADGVTVSGIAFRGPQSALDVAWEVHPDCTKCGKPRGEACVFVGSFRPGETQVTPHRERRLTPEPAPADS